MLNLQVNTVIVEGVEVVEEVEVVEGVEVNLKPLQPLQLTGCSCLRMSIKNALK
jgi:hypothetical protein